MSVVSTVWGIVKTALPEAIGLIEDIAKSGKDPITEIRRIRRTKPFLQEVDDAWEDAIDDKHSEDE